jgi:hypothetical protein
VSAEHVWVKPNAANPFPDKPSILPRRHGFAGPAPAGEKKSAGVLPSSFEVVINGLAGLLGQFETDRTAGLPLAHRCLASA